VEIIERETLNKCRRSPEGHKYGDAAAACALFFAEQGALLMRLQDLRHTEKRKSLAPLFLRKFRFLYGFSFPLPFLCSLPAFFVQTKQRTRRAQRREEMS
jgi:hypothetical protein